MLVKAAIAAGQFALPLIINAMANANANWKILFIAGAILLAVIFLIMLKVPFPDYKALAAEQKAAIDANAATEEGATGARIGMEASPWCCSASLPPPCSGSPRTRCPPSASTWPT